MSVSLRCILTGHWEIYCWKDKGYINQMSLTLVAYSCPKTMNAVFVKLAWGHSVGGQLLQPFLRTTWRQDRFWQQLLWLSSRTLPPTDLTAPSSWVSAHAAAPALFLSLGWAGYRRRCGQEKVFSLPCGHQSQFTCGKWRWWKPKS